MAVMEATAILSNIHFLDELFAGAPLQRTGFELWDGTRWPDAQPRAATLVLKHPAALREMFGAGTEKALAEAYLRNDFDIEGDIEAAFELAEALAARRNAGWLQALRSFWKLQRLPGNASGADYGGFVASSEARHSLARDRAAVSFHYDVSNAFYQLWLDRRMVYSCAYFERPDTSLDEAQEAKLRYLCRKLRLQAGQHLLDIGCGWGGLALYAAQHYGVRVTGVTLSRAQAELAIERVRAAGLAERVTIALQDYRELAPAAPFDAVVSVGMSEHVGAGELANYFQAGAALLRPGGVFLNHAIGEGVRPRARPGPSFIHAYVFPDTDIPPVPAVAAAAESAGLEVRDVENLREHYALTLRNWVRRLEAAHGEALRLVDEARFRVWRLYMAGSAHGFARGQLAVYQVLLAKPDAAGRSHVPLTRRDWYGPEE
jgi:cyclopropane-fatty-acyl-phospholipid synthase